MGPERVQRADYAAGSFVEHVCVDHCGRNIFVPQEFLNGPDIIAILEKMCGKAVSECMDGGLDAEVLERWCR